MLLWSLHCASRSCKDRRQPEVITEESRVTKNVLQDVLRMSCQFWNMAGPQILCKKKECWAWRLHKTRVDADMCCWSRPRILPKPCWCVLHGAHLGINTELSALNVCCYFVCFYFIKAPSKTVTSCLHCIKPFGYMQTGELISTAHLKRPIYLEGKAENNQHLQWQENIYSNLS